MKGRVMGKRLVVLDFDGTITDAEEEGKPYVTGYAEDLRLLLGKKAEEVTPVLLSAEAEIAANPGENGWLYNGLIVAPATVDPYLRMRAIARRVFDHFGAYADRTDRERLMDFLYTNNYSLSGVAFKDGACQMLCELCANDEIAVYVVTNSHTEGVRKKIVTLSAGNDELASMCERVIGGAKKYLVDGRPDHVAESVTLPGLSRPVYLRRSAYFEVLERLRETNSVDWEAVTVIGDIFELDLALPFALGARVGLVINQFTPEYERDFIAGNPARAGFINSLSEVQSFVSG
ncbi:MAG: HAD family hydrolase [Candidatus Magasanikbacteria bacterium]|nr:HAD family hydrolase [Candidatus Magasanikbacteria bacterium]